MPVCLNDLSSEVIGWQTKRTVHRFSEIPSSTLISPNSTLSSLPQLRLIKWLMQTKLLPLKSGIFDIIITLVPDMQRWKTREISPPSTIRRKVLMSIENKQTNKQENLKNNNQPNKTPPVHLLRDRYHTDALQITKLLHNTVVCAPCVWTRDRETSWPLPCYFHTVTRRKLRSC